MILELQAKVHGLGNLGVSTYTYSILSEFKATFRILPSFTTRSAPWFAGRLIGWLVGWLVAWSVGRLIGWLVGWLADWLASSGDDLLGSFAQELTHA